MNVTGISSLRRKLKKLQKLAAESNETVQVGYTQRYAVYVHEIQAKHKEGKQWKYLESPARKLKKVLADIVTLAATQTGSLKKGLLLAGYRLQRESQQIVPIDTAALKASAYVAYERDANGKASEAYAKSEAVRAATETRRTTKKTKQKVANMAKFLNTRKGKK